MNEQIQQMIFSLNDKVGVHWTNEDKIKFVELIVRECADKVDWILTEGGKTQGDLIKKHFGVAE